MSRRTITIIGAGIAGLTAALCLTRRGFDVDIVEQADALSDVGAGLQLSPNATRILDRLGILPELEAVWSEPERIALVSGLNFNNLAQVPVGQYARNRWKAPYGVLLRSSLQKALHSAVKSHPNSRLHLGQAIDGQGLTDLEAITGRKSELLVAADGVWSAHRSRIERTAPARFSGRIAWRTLLPFKSAPSFLNQQQVTAFLGPKSHLVCYPLKDAGAFNLVAISDGTERPKSFGKPLESNEYAFLEKAFSSWHEKIQSLVLTGSTPLCWPLYEMADSPWQNDRNLVLIGDAAHAMTPFAAQGACMAIEDAWILAEHLGRMPIADALPAFEKIRRPRIDRVRQRAAFNRFAYHARGPIRIGRDFVLSRRTPESSRQGF